MRSIFFVPAFFAVLAAFAFVHVEAVPTNEHLVCHTYVVRNCPFVA
jgi:hypothetical protein